MAHTNNREGEWVAIPLYVDIAERLRQQITNGTYGPGANLPTEAELQRRFNNASRNTVRGALRLLEREGLVSSGHRKWYVRTYRPLIWHASRTERNTRTDLSPADAWSEDVRAQGRTPSELISVTIVAPPPFVSERLGQCLRNGEPVVARKRLRYVDGEIVMLADTYYPHDLVAGTPIAQPSDVLPGVYAVMKDLGVDWDDDCRVDEIRSRPARREEAQIFGIPTGHAMTEHIRTRCTKDRRPVAVAVVIAPGDRVVIKYGEESE